MMNLARQTNCPVGMIVVMMELGTMIMMVMVTSLQILRSDSMIKEDNSVSFCKSLADVESADLSF